MMTITTIKPLSMSLNFFTSILILDSICFDFKASYFVKTLASEALKPILFFCLERQEGFFCLFSILGTFVAIMNTKAIMDEKAVTFKSKVLRLTLIDPPVRK